jgi:hypothetical protein
MTLEEPFAVINLLPRTVVSVSYYYKNPTQHVGLVESGPHHHLIEN